MSEPAPGRALRAQSSKRSKRAKTPITTNVSAGEAGSPWRPARGAAAIADAAQKPPPAWSGLEALVETEIIPRLMLAAQRHDSAYEERGEHVQLRDVERLIICALRRDVAGAVTLITAARARGVSEPAIYLDLIAAAARELGRRWDEDTSSFTDVTIGLVTLHQLLARLTAQIPEPDATQPPRRVLLGVVRGEEHRLGVGIVGAFLQTAGWEVRQDASASMDALQALLSREWYDAVGLSVSAMRFVDRIAADIAALRATSCNPGVKVVIGGAAASMIPDLARHVGADALAIDANNAVVVFDRLVAECGVAQTLS